MDPAHKETSRVQFGTARSKAANAQIRAYVWANDEYLAAATSLLLAFVKEWSSACTGWR